MSRVRVVSLLVGVLVAAGCGGGNGSGADAGPQGACPVKPFTMAFPSEEDPQFCSMSWDGTKPELSLTECGEVFESCSDTGSVPDFSCIDTPPGPPPATPATVTMRGYVDVFSSGPNADKARIQVFRDSDLDGVEDITTATPMTTFDIVLDATTLASARACPQSKDFMQGQCVLPTNDCGGQCDKVMGAGQFCYQTSCEDLQRWEVQYEIPNIPTNTFLVVRTVGLDNQGQPQVRGNTWAPMIQYNAYFATNDHTCADALDLDCIDTSGATPIYQVNVNLLSSQDYMTIPTTAGLSAGVPPGHGAFAGEVHDCNGVRVQHAQVGFDPGRDPSKLVFFNGNPVSTLPRIQQAADGTDPLGLYAGLDDAPGPIDLVAIGNMGGTVREIGRFTTRVWADSVTLVRIGGGRPPQP